MIISKGFGNFANLILSKLTAHHSYKKAYDKFYADRGNPPISKYTELMAKLVTENPTLKRNPGVIAGIPILESSGGKNVTYENNPVNWGIQVQKKGGFSPASWEETISKMATGIDNRQKDYTEGQGLTKFRKTGDLKALASWYAPSSDNPEYGGDVYAGHLEGYDNEIKALLKTFGVN
jgi:hypothetical protein